MTTKNTQKTTPAKPTAEQQAKAEAAKAATEKAAKEAGGPVCLCPVRFNGKPYGVGKLLPAGLSAEELAGLRAAGAISQAE